MNRSNRGFDKADDAFKKAGDDFVRAGGEGIVFGGTSSETGEGMSGIVFGGTGVGHHGRIERHFNDVNGQFCGACRGFGCENASLSETVDYLNGRWTYCMNCIHNGVRTWNNNAFCYQSHTKSNVATERKVQHTQSSALSGKNELPRGASSRKRLSCCYLLPNSLAKYSVGSHIQPIVVEGDIRGWERESRSGERHYYDLNGNIIDSEVKCARCLLPKWLEHGTNPKRLIPVLLNGEVCAWERIKRNGTVHYYGLDGNAIDKPPFSSCGFSTDPLKSIKLGNRICDWKRETSSGHAHYYDSLGKEVDSKVDTARAVLPKHVEDGVNRKQLDAVLWEDEVLCWVRTRRDGSERYYDPGGNITALVDFPLQVVEDGFSIDQLEPVRLGSRICGWKRVTSPGKTHYYDPLGKMFDAKVEAARDMLCRHVEDGVSRRYLDPILLDGKVFCWVRTRHDGSKRCYDLGGKIAFVVDFPVRVEDGFDPHRLQPIFFGDRVCGFKRITSRGHKRYYDAEGNVIDTKVRARLDQLPRKLDDGVDHSQLEPIVSKGQCIGFSRIRSGGSQRFYDVLGCTQPLPTKYDIERLERSKESFYSEHGLDDLVSKNARDGARLLDKSSTLSGFSVKSVEVESCLFSPADLHGLQKMPIQGGKITLEWILGALTAKANSGGAGGLP